MPFNLDSFDLTSVVVAALTSGALVKLIDLLLSRRGTKVKDAQSLWDLYQEVLGEIEKLRVINTEQWKTINAQSETIHGQKNKLQVQENKLWLQENKLQAQEERIKELEQEFATYRDGATKHMDELKSKLPDGTTLNTERPNGKHKSREV